MGKVSAETCSVCNDKASKYRCPGCAMPYCSLACNKAHKSGAGGNIPCSGKRARSENPSEATSVPQSAETVAYAKRVKASQGEGGVGAATNAAGETVESETCERKARDQWRGGKIEEDEEEEWQMTAAQQGRLSQSEWMKAALRDPKLQTILVSWGFCRRRGICI